MVEFTSALEFTFAIKPFIPLVFGKTHFTNNSLPRTYLTGFR